MNKEILNDFQRLGLYGLIDYVQNVNTEEVPRVKAYNLLKFGRQIAKNSSSKDLKYLTEIAFGLSRHESIYRMAGLLNIELGEIDKAIECLSYLHFYYKDNNKPPHDQYYLIKTALEKKINKDDNIEEKIQQFKKKYTKLSMISSIKEYHEIMSITDQAEQQTYISRLYHSYGINTVITAIDSDIRLSDREKAIIMIRAGKTISAFANEGVAIESVFADKALQLDTSNTVVKIAHQAYLRAGDLDKIQLLNDLYSKSKL